MTAGTILKDRIQAINDENKSAAAALDDAIINDPTLSHKTRMVLIHLQSASRKQGYALDLMLIELEHLEDKHRIVMNHLTNK